MILNSTNFEIEETTKSPIGYGIKKNKVKKYIKYLEKI